MNLTPQDFKIHFESQAAKYFDFADDHISWLNIEKPALVGALDQINRHSSVLDIGCGHGRTIRMLLADGFSPKNITGVDISEKCVELAKERLPGIELLVMDFVETPNLSKKYDVALSNMVINSLSNKSLESFVKNTYNTLAKKGIFICQSSHPERIKASLNYKEEFFYEDTPWGEKVPTFPRTIEQQQDIFKKAGFSQIEIREPKIMPTPKSQKNNYSKTLPRLLFIATK